MDKLDIFDPMASLDTEPIDSLLAQGIDRGTRGRAYGTDYIVTILEGGEFV